MAKISFNQVLFCVHYLLYFENVSIDNDNLVILSKWSNKTFIETRQRGWFAGFYLYIANTSGIEGSTLCYKDGPQLPPLNFTTVCTVSGRYVIFYNERLDETSYPKGYQLQNVFTELCEVIVKGNFFHNGTKTKNFFSLFLSVYI